MLQVKMSVVTTGGGGGDKEVAEEAEVRLVWALVEEALLRRSGDQLRD